MPSELWPWAISCSKLWPASKLRGSPSRFHLHFFLQPEALQEPVNRGGIEIVLVRSRLFGLGFDQDLAVKADFFRVLDDEAEEAGGLV